MPVWHISVWYLASVLRHPSHFNPILLLLLQKDLLILQIFPHFHHNIIACIYLTSYKVRFHCICYISYCVFFSNWIFHWNLCIFIVLIKRQEMNTPLWKLIKDWSRSPVFRKKVLEVRMVFVGKKSDACRPYFEFESKSYDFYIILCASCPSFLSWYLFN